jgi:signal transduction histidine kinase
MKKDILIYEKVLFRVVPRREYQVLIESLLDGLSAEVLAVNRQGVVIVWNQRLAERVCSKENALGRPIGDLIERITDPLRAVDIEEIMRDVVMDQGKSVYLDRYPQRDKDQNTILYDIRIDPLRLPHHPDIAGAVFMRTDVTEKYQSSDRKMRTARTSSLANLGASIAHEIRNPLNSISVHVQLLREELAAKAETADEVLDSVEMILEEIDRLNRIVENFLRFSRMHSPSLKPADLNEVVEKAIKLLEPEAEASGVALRFSKNPVESVALDNDLFRQALHNLLLNAIQASPHGANVNVGIRRARHSIVVEIADQGPGVPPNERDRIFDLFYSRREGGSGLGLPIANRIVEEHQGRISISQSAAGGACFEIHLPLAAEDR